MVFCVIEFKAEVPSAFGGGILAEQEITPIKTGSNSTIQAGFPFTIRFKVSLQVHHRHPPGIFADKRALLPGRLLCGLVSRYAQVRFYFGFIGAKI